MEIFNLFAGSLRVMRFFYTAAAILALFAWDFSQNYGQMFWWINSYTYDALRAFELT